MKKSKKEKTGIQTPEKNELHKEYDKFAEVRQLIVSELRNRIEVILTAIDSNPVISGRIKNFSSYFTKYIRLLKNNQKTFITDLMGIRIICPFIEDLQASENLIHNHFHVTEKEVKGHFTFKEFGYESTHLLIKIPQDLIEKYGYPGSDIIEVQIRTILQDAWAEVEHELVYKADFSPFDEPMKRKLAAVNASLSLADIIFQEVRSYQRKYTREMEKRRESFYQKIEESTDNLLFSQEADFIHTDRYDFTQQRLGPSMDEKDSIDDLLINALSAHNQNNFNKAIGLYTKILDLKPDNIVCSVIHKHRGMAHFASSRYETAIEDFTASLEFDNSAYKSAYYRGVVRSVLKQYAKAIDDYTIALKINPYQPFCLFRRAQAFFHIGDFPVALADCDNSLALEPENNAAEKLKGILHEKLKM